MEKKNVWKVTSKQKVPLDRRLLGTKWVFKVKKDGVFKARLVAQDTHRYQESIIRTISHQLSTKRHLD